MSGLTVISAGCTVGRVKMEPLVLLAFSLCFKVMFAQKEANPCYEANLSGLVALSLILLAFRLSWVLKPRIHHLSCWTPKWAFLHSKTSRFKGKMSNFDAKATIKLGHNAKRISPFSACTRWPRFRSVTVRAGSGSSSSSVRFRRFLWGKGSLSILGHFFLTGGNGTGVVRHLWRKSFAQTRHTNDTPWAWLLQLKFAEEDLKLRQAKLGVKNRGGGGPDPEAMKTYNMPNTAMSVAAQP